jgi:hypothetical protein
MKKTLLLTSVLLALTVSVALAGGLNFGWGTVCYTESGVSSVTFACLTNTFAGGWPMTASFVLDAPMADFVGVDVKMEGKSDAASLPDWWKIGNAGDCRTGKATFTAAFGGVADDVCLDWFGASTLLVTNYTWDTNRAHVIWAAAVDAAFPLDPDVEYYAGQMTVLNSKTVGTGACTGCLTGMKWGLYEVMVSGNVGSVVKFQEPIPGGNACLDWNHPTVPCAMPVPVRNTTWGQVKSLYR